MKHLALMRVVELVRPSRYLESHSGAFDYPLAERDGPLPDGVWDFLAAAPAVHALAKSSYRALLTGIAGTPELPGVYPGSMRCVWELLGTSARYGVSDTDTEALASVGFALESRGAAARLSSRDGVDMVLDEAEPGDLVLIDPFDPAAASPEHGLSALEAFDALVARGAAVILWRALHGQGEPAPAPVASDLTVTLEFAAPTGSMDGCELLLGGIGADVAAEVARLALAHGAIVGNGHVRMEAARVRHVPKEREKSSVPASAMPTPAAGALFDRYVMIDWSARNEPTRVAPKGDAIWVGDESPAEQDERYCRTRHDAFEEVSAILRDAVAKQQRVLVGFDFPFGYPRGFAAAVGLDTRAPWKSVWLDLVERITDDERNENNRFDVARFYNQQLSAVAGPFWGCPDKHDFGGLTKTKKGLISFPYGVASGELAEFRATEVLIPGTVQETWKLSGNGSVGSQALVGINRVAMLRFSSEFGSLSQVWPFETGLTAPDLPPGTAAVVFAEIWPGIVDANKLAGLMAKGLIKDQAQVRLMCEWARDHDAVGTLNSYFEPPQAMGEHSEAVVLEEGWILGCL